MIFTRSPSTTLVISKSTTAAKGLWIISEETNGSSETDNTNSYLLVFDSSARILLISSAEVFRAAIKVMSEIEPTGTGVRIATPSNLPYSRVRALVVAIAAPVEAGARFTAAALPILGSTSETLPRPLAPC